MEVRSRQEDFKKKLLQRMERVSGQTRGICKMIEEDRYCIDILIQIGAIKGALNQVALQLIEDHTGHCLRKAMDQGGEVERERLNELMEALKRIL